MEIKIGQSSIPFSSDDSVTTSYHSVSKRGPHFTNTETKAKDHSSENADLLAVWQKELLTPVEDLLNRPKKQIRGRLIQAAFDLAGGNLDQPELSQKLMALSTCIEWLHAASLIVDDIEDNSEVRRGDLTLHLKYGLPRALNAGNWLYFEAFEPLWQGPFSEAQRMLALRATHKVLVRAHYGQAIDLGTDMMTLEEKRIPSLVKASLELKSGELMGLSMEYGGILANASPEILQRLRSFGIKFGCLLQIYDDLGNLQVEQPTPKHLEDLTNRRPSFIWSFLARSYPSAVLAQFKETISHLPDVMPLRDFLDQHQVLGQAYKEADRLLEECIETISKTFSVSSEAPCVKQIMDLSERIKYGYRSK